jgi:hypothetical protein
MRTLLALAAVLAVAAPAEAIEIESVSIRGDPVVGGVVGVVVETRDATRVRVTFPDLHGSVMQRIWLGPGGSTSGARRFVLPYRPAWPGRHVLVVGAKGGGRTAWRPLVVDVAEGPAEVVRGTGGSLPDLIAGARLARGLPRLLPIGRRRASLRLVASVSGPVVAPSALVESWLAGDAFGALLDPAVRRIGVRVIEHRRRQGATYVLRLN